MNDMTQDFNPYNPYGYRDEIPGWEKMTDEECKQATHTHLLFGCVTYAVGLVIALLLCWLFGSCAATKYVPVERHTTEHHWHTDSVKEHDSIHTERETIIREVDSAAMARYGIQMEKNQRAWLILQREMEQRLRELEYMSAHKDTVRDSIPYPVEVVKEVPAQLSWWQQARLHLANIVLYLLAVVAIICVGKRHFRQMTEK